MKLFNLFSTIATHFLFLRCQQPQINEMLQGFSGNLRSMADKHRNRSVSESDTADTEPSPRTRARRLSGGSSSVNMSTLHKPTSSTSVNLVHYRNRSESFGSGRLGHSCTKRRQDSSGSQRDLTKQQYQPKSRHNSGSFTRPLEVPKINSNKLIKGDTTSSIQK